MSIKEKTATTLTGANKVIISAQLGFPYLEEPLAGMGAAGESHGQSCAWGLHCLNVVSYGTSSAAQTGSTLQEYEQDIRLVYVLQMIKTESFKLLAFFLQKMLQMNI